MIFKPPVKVKHARGTQNLLVLLMWSAHFGRKLVLGTRSKWPRPRRDRVLDNFSREETETRRWYVSRPRPQLWFQRTAIATFSSYYLIILLVYCRKQKQEKSLSLLTTSDFGAFDILSCTNGHTALHYTGRPTSNPTTVFRLKT